MLFSKPVIGALTGYAVAGGLEMAILCDLRVADESTVMGVFNRRFGIIAKFTIINKLQIQSLAYQGGGGGLLGPEIVPWVMGLVYTLSSNKYKPVHSFLSLLSNKISFNSWYHFRIYISNVSFKETCIRSTLCFVRYTYFSAWLL